MDSWDHFTASTAFVPISYLDEWSNKKRGGKNFPVIFPVGLGFS